MPQWIFDLLICLGLSIAAYLCLRFQNVWMKRLGIWLIFTSLGTCIWFISKNWILVTVGLSTWFIIPVAQAVYLSRILRFPKQAQLQLGNLYEEEENLEDIQSITSELRKLDFVWDKDYWLEPSPIKNGFRLFHHREKPISAALSIIKQGGMELFYTQFITADSKNNFWITWNFPLAYNMKIPPELKIYRCLSASTVSILFYQHDAYLKINQVESKAAEEIGEISSLFNHLNNTIIRYNLDIGMLRNYPNVNEQIGYSWYGTWYIFRQVLWGMLTG